MWLIYVLVGLALLVVAGLYVRRRITGALRVFGVRERRIRIVGWIIVYLLYAFPLTMIGGVAISVALGRASFPRFDGLAGALLFAVPFAWAGLTVAQSIPWLLASEVATFVVKRRRGAAPATRFRAISALVVVGAFAIYFPIRVLAERGDLRVRHHSVGTGSAPPFRIAFIADVQQDVFTDSARAREVYATVNAEHPDVVLSGGDWINTGAEYIAPAAEDAATLNSRLGTFSVRGDHEHFAYLDRERSVREVEQAMTAHGIAMLNNEVRWFEHAGKRIAVAFINYNYVVRSTPAQIGKLLDGTAGADYRIAVTHQLDDKLTAQLADRVDLILGAHTHGGQVNPVVGLVHVPLARLETRFIDGRYQHGKTTIIITAGIGMSVVPFRYAAPGSLDFIDLRL